MSKRNPTRDDMIFEPDPKGPVGEFFAPVAGFGVTFRSFFRPTVTEQYPYELRISNPVSMGVTS